MTDRPAITPLAEIAQSWRTGTISGLTAGQIADLLGLPSTATDPAPGKVDHEWTFAIDGEPCNVWSYKGSHRQRQFSTYGPAGALRAVFGNAYSPDA